jgi:acyl carrier protein
MNTKEQIKNFIVERINNKASLLNVTLDEIPDDFSLTGSGVFDSIDFMDLIASVETAFRVKVDFSDSDPENFTTLSGFVDCIS